MPLAKTHITLSQLVDIVFRPQELSCRELLGIYGYNSIRYKIASAAESELPLGVDSRELLVQNLQEQILVKYGTTLQANPEFELIASGPAVNLTKLRAVIDDKRKKLGNSFEIDTDLPETLAELIILRGKETFKPRPNGDLSRFS